MTDITKAENKYHRKECGLKKMRLLSLGNRVEKCLCLHSKVVQQHVLTCTDFNIDTMLIPLLIDIDRRCNMAGLPLKRRVVYEESREVGDLS
jgi:hypothetical protein